MRYPLPKRPVGPTAWTERSEDDQYSRLFYFTKADRVIENLLNKEIKISEFAKCNDLFELSSVNLGNLNIRNKHQKWSTSVNQEMGLICFSGSWRHPLMWAHYAGDSSGLCLVFDVLKEKIEVVKYPSERVKLSPDVSFPEKNELRFRQFCAMKAKFWEYENEHRFFVEFSDSQVQQKDGLNFLALGNDVKLVGVINGPKARLGRRIVERATENVRFFQCRAANTRFEMVYNSKKNEWKP